MTNRKKYHTIKRLERWDYIGNALLGKYLKVEYGYFRVDRTTMNCLPEYKYLGDSQDCVRNYQSFYFENDFSNEVMNETKGIILLHNSWTPQEFLAMNQKEFLEQNNTLANILKMILYKSELK